MRILIGSSKSYYHDFQELVKELRKLGFDFKLVEEEWIQPFGRNLIKWFKTKSKYRKLIKEYHPDFVLVDSQTIFAEAAMKEKIPLFIFLRGNYWEEIKLARETLCKYPPKRIWLWFMDSIAEKCFKKSACIMSVCGYLDEIVRQRYPEKSTYVLHGGINPSEWFPEKGFELKHPCVGLVQGATIWGKTREMLILPKILEAMPDVTFYWGGDGPYKNKVLPALEKHENFKWLGSLEYPKQVRQFLNEIDVYALITGLDMQPRAIMEAYLMGKPIVATNVGGVSENMKNNETGFLVEQGDIQDWIEKLNLLLQNQEKATKMGRSGKSFVMKNYYWDIIAKNLYSILEREKII